MKPTHRLALALTLAAGTSPGWASEYNCESVASYLRYLASYPGSSGASYIPRLVEEAPQCFPGSPSNGRTEINSTSFVHAMSNSSAMGQRHSPGGPAVTAVDSMRGMAAGEAMGKWNAWGSLTRNDTSQDLAVPVDTDILTGVLGVDYGISPTTVVGVSASFDRGDVGATAESDGFLISPYVGVQINPEWSFDASLGLGQGNFDDDTAGTSAEAERWFAAANLSYNRWFDNIQVTGKASYLHGVEDYEDTTVAGLTVPGTGAKNTIDQMRLGAQVGYWKDGFMPYLSAGYTNDFNRDNSLGVANPIGDDAWVWGVGANFYSLANGITGGIAYNRESGRDQQDNYTLMGNLNVRF